MLGDASRRLSYVLAASIFVNLFLGGVIAARWFHPGGERGGGALIVHAQLHELPDSERFAFLAAMHRHAPALAAARERVRSAKQAAEDAIIAPHYDGALLSRRFADLRAAVEAQQTILHEATVEGLATLSIRSRALLVRHAHGIQDGHS
jgi:uncharacterized membrane protein